jgi:hypothetical protein
VAQLLSERLQLRPARGSLLDQVRVHVSDEWLTAISRLDYDHDAPRHFEALARIRDSGTVPEITHSPREVLELAQWASPQDEPQHPLSSPHAIRLFACTVLIVAAGDPINRRNLITENQTVAGLIASLPPRDLELLCAAIALLMHRLETGVDSEQRAFFAFAVLLILAMWRPKELSTSDWETIANWVIEEESASREATGYRTGPWLLGTSTFSSQHAIWTGLARRHLSSSRIGGTELVLAGVDEWPE